MATSLQAGYEARSEQYYDVNAGLLGVDSYANIIFGLDAATEHIIYNDGLNFGNGCLVAFSRRQHHDICG